MKEKSLAIVIPVFNSGKYLSEFMDSLLTQSFNDFDIYIINDGSTDNSLEILNKYKQLDTRINLISQLNKGVGSARNRGMDEVLKSKVKYRYIYFCDSDDILEANFIENSIRNIKLNNVDMLITKVVQFRGERIKEQSKEDYKEEKLDSIGIPEQYFKLTRKWRKHESSNCFLNNKIFKIENVLKLRFDENLRRSGDFDFFIRLIPKIHSAVIINNTAYYYREHSESISSREKKLGDFEACYKVVIDKLHWDSYNQIAKKGISDRLIRGIYKNGEFYTFAGLHDSFDKDLKLFNRIRKQLTPSISSYRYLVILKLPTIIQRKIFKVKKMIRKLV